MPVEVPEPDISVRPKRAYRRVRLKSQNLEEAARIADRFGLGAITARILAARGYQADQRAENFLKPALKSGLPDPGGLKNLDKACDLIAKTLKAKKPIAICCDFDVDGLSGGAIVCHFLRSAGAQVEVFVPDRFVDGYGLNEAVVRKIAKSGFGLMIAIDYGTTNLAELALAKELGVATIVVDHHHVSSDLPPADAFINPQQEGCGFGEGMLCAAGLAWYLIIGLRHKLPQAKKIDAKSYLDLACLGTICDMVPLLGVNRVIAKRGLELLAATERVGLQALKGVAGVQKSVSCTHVGFGLGPRLNAAGRMVHGEVVIELLTTDDSDRAGKLARKLNKLNAERQDTEARIKELAVQQVEKKEELPWGLVIWDKEFHTGVIGLVAQRLVEIYYRPAVVIGSDQGKFKGSVRGISGFSVVEALSALGSYLQRFGGHEGAGGFSIAKEKIPAFVEAFNEECRCRLQGFELTPYIEADTEAGLEDITPGLIDELGSLAPFGIGNPAPSLLIKGLQVMDVRTLKNEHLKALLSDGRRNISGLMWRQRQHPALEAGAKVDVVCRPDKNLYAGHYQLQLNLQAVERVR